MTADDPLDHRALLQRSLAALDELEAELRDSEARRHEPIAVVGMGLRFPGGVRDPASFWSLLMSGRDAVTEVPPDRWDVEAIFDPDPGAPGKAYTRWGAFLDDVAGFDPGLFGIAPREAVSMDPQQRLLLEVAWEALEHAGIAVTDVAGTSTGVFVGIIGTEYADLALQGGIMAEADAYFASGVSQSVAAGRLAYVFDLQGPAIAVDTACSSSLVATHLACQSLRAGDCDAALAAGVNLMLSPDAHIVTSQARMMSFEGRCKTFDASADGYVRGEGCAVLVLKRLRDAVAAGDRILATIAGTAINQDGRSNGLTAPNALAQEAVIRAALADGGIAPGEVGFVECHGTGTTLGDPIEVRALQAVFGEGRPAEHPLRVQSVKTNIGHLEAAAGIAGLCKLILAVHEGTLPRHLHLTEPNPYIPWRNIAVTPEPGPRPWDGEGDSADAAPPRVGGISSFGFSGTNVHMVVRQAPDAGPADAPSDRGHRLYAVSARTATALDQLVTTHSAALAATDPARWPQAAATSTTGRAHLEERVAVVARSTAEASRLLAAVAESSTSADARRGRATSGLDDGVVMLFTGQGSQVPGMGRQLYEIEPVFRAALDRGAELLHEVGGFDLLDVMFHPGPPQREVSIHDTRFTQPALFAYEVAMAALWRSWGVEPAAVLGHSVGELAAAHVAGVLSLEDGLRLVEARGRLMQGLPRDGGMAAVFADEATAREAIAPWSSVLSVAALNGPRNVVISGRTDALDAAVAGLQAAGVKVTRLEVSHAFHSPSMEPILEAFEAVAASVALDEPEIELISNRTAGAASPGLLTAPGYWRDHIREPVRFEESLRHAVDLGYRTFLEVGPSPTLTAMARGCSLPADVVLHAPSRRSDDEALEVQRTLAGLHVHGVGIDWRAYEGARRPPVTLPSYAFDHQRYWHPRVDADRRGAAAPSTTDSSALAGRPLRSPRLDAVVFEREMSPHAPAWMADHVIHGATIVPAAAYLELMRRVGQEAGGAPVDVVDVRIEEPLVLGDEPVTVQTIVDGDAVEIVSATGDRWQRHATGRLAAPDGAAATALAEPWTGALTIDGADYYDAVARMGVAFGPRFRRIERAARRDGAARATVRATAGEDEPGGLHPGVVDAALQVVGLAMPGAAHLGEVRGDVYLPVGVERWHVVRPPVGNVSVNARLRPSAGDGQQEVVIGDVDLTDAAGELLGSLEGVRLKRVPRQALAAPSGAQQEWIYRLHWTPAPLLGGAVAPAEGASVTVVGSGDIATALDLALRGAGRSAEVVPGDGDGTVEELVGAVEARLGAGPTQVALVLPLGDRSPAFESACVAALSTVLAEREGASLTVVTPGAMAVVPDDDVRGHRHAAAWGVGRVAASEHLRSYCRLVDIAHTDDVVHVVDELAADDRVEPQVAWREGVRYALRLARPGRSSALPAPTGPYRLEIADRGRLDALALVPHDEPVPGPGEVLIDVRATGLNFRDVLQALGTYAGEASSLGSECAGVVLAIGDGVTRVRVGDRVMAVAATSFASSCVAPQEMVVAQPAGWTDAQSATAPVAFLTAAYALEELGGVRAGQRVLVHAAAGGVGMAAVQVAQRAGAEVFATAGSNAKRERLRALGVHHVYDSRQVAFKDEILRDTGGAGVDLVLNSLSGSSIDASVHALAAGGTFLEIGLAGIWDAERFRVARPDAPYHVIYLGQVCVDQPDLIARMLDLLTAAFERGTLQPLPTTAFDIRDSVAAFRFMAQARHTGKVVVTAARGWALADAAGGWIVTGGLGGLGLSVAAELVESGASRVVLCGRRPPSPEVEPVLAELRDGSAEIWTVELDVSDGDAVAAMVKEVTADGLPLRGVIHAAGVLDDGLLRDLTADRFEAAARPKVLGAEHLATATDPHQPEHFILFSAGAGLLGAPGQGSYAAANAALDAMAHARRADGRPAQTIDWGPWASVGMAARLGDDAARRWEAQGIGALLPGEGRRALRAAAVDGSAQLAALKLRWPALLHHFSKHPAPSVFADLIRSEQRRTVTGDSGPAASSFVDELTALPVDGRREHLDRAVREQLLAVLGLDATHPIDAHQGLTDVGVDSLMAVELSNRLSVMVDRTLPSTLTFEHPTLADLTLHLVDLLRDRVALTEPSDATPASSPPAVDDFEELAGLTDGELTDALLQELDDAGY